MSYLAEHGLVPGTSITLETLEPVDELRTIKTESGNVVLGRQMASQLYVEAEALPDE